MWVYIPHHVYTRKIMERDGSTRENEWLLGIWAC